MEKVISYIKESFDEVRHKVSWPTSEQLQRSTVLVLVASVIFALVIGLADYGFENLMKLVYSL